MPIRHGRSAWAIAWSAFVAGIAASLAANVAHAEPTMGARFVAGWAPVALLLTIEVMMRVPPPRSWWLRIPQYLGATAVAGVAGLASFRHMKGLALQHGEDELTANTLPLSVDGLVIVASIALLTLASQRRAAARTAVALAGVGMGQPAPSSIPPPTEPVLSSGPLPGSPSWSVVAGRELRPDVVTQPDADSAPEPVAVAGPEPDAGPGPVAVVAPEPAPGPGPGPDAVAVAVAGAGPEPGPDAVAVARVGPGADAVAVAGAGPEPDAVAVAGPGPVAVAGLEPGPSSDAPGTEAAAPLLPLPRGARAGEQPAVPAELGSVLDELDAPTRQLYLRAYELFLKSVAERRPLTGEQLGRLCQRGERWGRNRIAEVKAARQSAAARQELAASVVSS